MCRYRPQHAEQALTDNVSREVTDNMLNGAFVVGNMSKCLYDTRVGQLQCLSDLMRHETIQFVQAGKASEGANLNQRDFAEAQVPASNDSQMPLLNKQHNTAHSKVRLPRSAKAPLEINVM